jgi:hypothetical protein
LTLALFHVTLNTCAVLNFCAAFYFVFTHDVRRNVNA